MCLTFEPQCKVSMKADCAGCHPHSQFCQSSCLQNSAVHDQTLRILQVTAPPLGYTSVFLAPRTSASAGHGATTPVTTLAATTPASETFALQAPPLGTSAIEAAAQALGGALAVPLPAPRSSIVASKGPITLENEHLALEFDRMSGTLAAAVHKQTRRRVRLAMDVVYFESTRGGGAYLMTPGAQVRLSERFSNVIGGNKWKIGALRTGVTGAQQRQQRPAHEWLDLTGMYTAQSRRCCPACSSVMQVPLTWSNGGTRAHIATVASSVVQEARISFNGWASVVVRLWRGAQEAEIEWTVGPIPVADGIGKEVMLRLRSDIDSGVLPPFLLVTSRRCASLGMFGGTTKHAVILCSSVHFRWAASDKFAGHANVQTLQLRTCAALAHLVLSRHRAHRLRVTAHDHSCSNPMHTREAAVDSCVLV